MRITRCCGGEEACVVCWDGAASIKFEQGGAFVTEEEEGDEGCVYDRGALRIDWEEIHPLSLALGDSEWTRIIGVL